MASAAAARVAGAAVALIGLTVLGALVWSQTKAQLPALNTEDAGQLQVAKRFLSVSDSEESSEDAKVPDPSSVSFRYDSLQETRKILEAFRIETERKEKEDNSEDSMKGAVSVLKEFYLEQLKVPQQEAENNAFVQHAAVLVVLTSVVWRENPDAVVKMLDEYTRDSLSLANDDEKRAELGGWYNMKLMVQELRKYYVKLNGEHHSEASEHKFGSAEVIKVIGKIVVHFEERDRPRDDADQKNRFEKAFEMIDDMVALLKDQQEGTNPATKAYWKVECAKIIKSIDENVGLLRDDVRTDDTAAP